MPDPTARIRLTLDEIRLLTDAVTLIYKDIHLERGGLRPPDLMMDKLRRAEGRILTGTH